MKNFATMFSGGGLADVGLSQAGLTHAWGIELDAKRAAVARVNGFDVRARNVLTTDPKSLARVDWLHASPPCTSFSQANSEAAKREGGRATELDLALALSVAEYAQALEPEWVSVENVIGWQDTEPERALRAAMIQEGYKCAAWVLDAADFGTPQRRRRLFLVFSRTKTPRRPSDTHGPTADLFRRAWVGWDAVCDGWQDLEPRPLTGRMAATLTHSLAAVAQCDSRYKGAILTGKHTMHAREGAVAVLGGSCNPLQDAEGMRLPIYRYAHEPSPALTQHACLQAVTKDGAYTLTSRHIARICGLPDSWITPDTLTMTREVCGLGVCPPVLRAIVEAQRR